MPTPYIIGPDPYWRRDMTNRWANALNVMLQMMDARERKENERMRMELTAMQQNPNVALQNYDGFVDRYGDKPGIKAIADGLKNDAEEAMRQRQVVASFANQYVEEADRMSGLGKAQAMVRQSVERGMPQVNLVTGAPRSDPPVRAANVTPQLAGATAGAEMAAANMQQGSPQWQAFQGLPPDQRAALAQMMMAGSLKGLEPTPPVAPVNKDFAEALGAGFSPQRAQQAAGVGQGIIPHANIGAQADVGAEKFARDVEEQKRQEAERLRQAEIKADLALRNKQAAPGRAPRQAPGESPAADGKYADRLLSAMAKDSDAAAKKEEKGDPAPVTIPPDLQADTARIAGSLPNPVLTSRDLQAEFKSERFQSRAKLLDPQQQRELWLAVVQAYVQKRTMK